MQEQQQKQGLRFAQDDDKGEVSDTKSKACATKGKGPGMDRRGLG